MQQSNRLPTHRQDGRMRRRGLFTAGAAAVASVVLPSCSAAWPQSAQEPEKQDIRFGTVPMLDAAPFYIGLAQGVFADNGLRVQPVVTKGGEEAIPLLLDGKLDFFFGNYVSVALALAQGKPLQIVADGAAAVADTMSIVAMPDSRLVRRQEFAGSRVAVNTLHNTASTLVSSALEAHAQQDVSVNFVPIPFPQMLTALRDRVVDAAFLPEPYLTEAKTTLGVLDVLDPLAGGADHLPLDGYVTTADFARRNPATVSAVRRVIERCSGEAARRSSVKAALSGVLPAAPATLDLVQMPSFSRSLEPGRLQRVPDMLFRRGLVGQRIDVRSFVRR